MAIMNAEVYGAHRVMSGNAGEVWVDDDYYGEATAFKASYKKDYSEIRRVRNSSPSRKLTGSSGEGEIAGNHIRSFWHMKEYDNISNGIDKPHTIMYKLNDPDAYGCEQYVFYNCTIDEIPIADSKLGENVEESVSFAFTHYEAISTVEDVELTPPED